MIKTYIKVSSVIKGFSEQLDIEKFHDVYDISDFDISDAMQGFSDREFDDPESVKTLKIAAARFHTIRKIFLCSLLALEATGDNTDFLRWSTAVESLRALTEATDEGLSKVRQILDEEESKPFARLESGCNSLTRNSFPHGSRVQIPIITKPREATISVSKTQLFVHGHPWTSSQARVVTRGV